MYNAKTIEIAFSKNSILLSSEEKEKFRLFLNNEFPKFGLSWNSGQMLAGMLL